ncbi:B-box zinc finger family protein, putative [Babesia ovis]|uniref:B-box zinc finger family protein, putative n=1 Tax=Babesia ovis TaxID=5869 RepID=A0A9W5TDY7_BABOV|nr:B-box zinc finger family protein, putative [Babesia ovis]
MAPVLSAQSSTSTNDEEDIYATYGPIKRNCSTGLTSVGCVSSYCHSPEVPDGTSQRHIDLGVEKVLSNVYEAICDLYNEDIFPTMHEIRRKLQRHNSHLVDGNWLLRICKDDSYHRFQIVNVTRGATYHNDNDIQHSCAIMLAGRPFLQHDMEPADPRDLAEVFHHAVCMASTHGIEWEHALQHQDESQRLSNVTQLGGRYLFADYLRKVGSNRFRRLPLGRVVRIVQDAIDVNILSYDCNNVVPVVSSVTAAKKVLAQFAMNKHSSTMRRDAQIRNIRDNIVILLSDKPQKSNDGPGKSMNASKGGGLTLKLNGSDNSISLCKLPLIYKKRFGQDLDFTAGGYSKLTDFLRNEVPECCLEPVNTTFKNDQGNGHSFDKAVIMASIKYKCSTNILFPLAMNSSRLSENAAYRLVTEW